MQPSTSILDLQPVSVYHSEYALRVTRLLSSRKYRCILSKRYTTRGWNDHVASKNVLLPTNHCCYVALSCESSQDLNEYGPIPEAGTW